MLDEINGENSENNVIDGVQSENSENNVIGGVQSENSENNVIGGVQSENSENNSISGASAEYSEVITAANDNTETSTTSEDNANTDNFVEVSTKKKEKSRFGKFVAKSCKLIAGAAVFGLVAGGVFYGVNYYADKVLGTNVVIPAEKSPVDTIFELQTAGSSNNIKNTSTSALGMDVSDIVTDTMSAMVSIDGTITTQSYNLYGFNPFFNMGSTETPTAGSGVIIGQSETEMLIVTNAHVVENVNNLKVTFIDGCKANATVKGTKSDRDIAVIAVKFSELSENTKKAVSIIEIGNSDELKVGEPVIAIGNALGEGQSVTVGWVSALNNTIKIDSTEYSNLIRISAAINPGNSGGALLNPQGQLIGINSAKNFSESVEGIGYAIPISSVADIISNLVNRTQREVVAENEKGYMGIGGIDITADINKVYGWPIGLAVSQVEEGGPSDKAGLVKNDIIVEFDGNDVSNFDELKELLNYYRTGETVEIKYYRLQDGEYVLSTTSLTLGSRNNQ